MSPPPVQEDAVADGEATCVSRAAFANITACIYGYHGREKRDIVDIVVKQGGGKYSYILSPEVELLIAPRGEVYSFKVQQARERNLYVLDKDDVSAVAMGTLPFPSAPRQGASAWAYAHENASESSDTSEPAVTWANDNDTEKDTRPPWSRSARSRRRRERARYGGRGRSRSSSRRAHRQRTRRHTRRTPFDIDDDGSASSEEEGGEGEGREYIGNQGKDPVDCYRVFEGCHLPMVYDYPRHIFGDAAQCLPWTDPYPQPVTLTPDSNMDIIDDATGEEELRGLQGKGQGNGVVDYDNHDDDGQYHLWTTAALFSDTDISPEEWRWLYYEGRHQRQGGNPRISLPAKHQRVQPDCVDQAHTEVASPASLSIRAAYAGDVFSWAPRAGLATLGLGDRGPHMSATRIATGVELASVVDVVSSSSATLFLTRGGQLYTCGSGHTNTLGFPDTRDRLHPEHLALRLWSQDDLVMFRFIACGPTHCAAISTSNQLWTWGRNKYGQVGRTHDKSIHIPGESPLACHVPGRVELPFRQAVRSVACGSDFTLVLTYDGSVYGFGNNRYGQLCHEDTCGRHVSSPLHIARLAQYQVVMLACGTTFAAALTAHGDVLTWGKGHRGELGRGNDDPEHWWKEGFVHFRADRKTGAYPRIVSIQCGGHHSLALSAEGHVYVWGEGQEGRLGVKLQRSFVSRPVRLIFQHDASTRDSNQPNHSDEDDNDGDGDGDRYLGGGQAGSGDEPCIRGISCGRAHSAVVSTQGDIYIWGHGFEPRPQRVTSLAYADLIACGGDACFALVTNHAQLLLQYCRRGEIDILRTIPAAELLISRDPTRHEYTLLHWASELGLARVAEYLLEIGASVRDTDAYGRSALHIASARGHVEIVKLFMSIDETVGALADKNGATPLHAAARYAQMECIPHLIASRYVDTNCVNNYGDTPLHIAIRHKHHTLARFLIKNAAADVYRLNKKGLSPLSDLSHEKEAAYHALADQHDVFISYAHSDIALVRLLKNRIERDNIRCWMDEFQLAGGSDWRGEIGTGILKCKTLVYVLTPTSVASEWCLKEMQMARARGRLICPVVIKECTIPPRIMAACHKRPVTHLTGTIVPRNGGADDTGDDVVNTSAAVVVNEAGFSEGVASLVGLIKRTLRRFEQRGPENSLGAARSPLSQLYGQPFVTLGYDSKRNLALGLMIADTLAEAGINCCDCQRDIISSNGSRPEGDEDGDVRQDVHALLNAVRLAEARSKTDPVTQAIEASYGTIVLLDTAVLTEGLCPTSLTCRLITQARERGSTLYPLITGTTSALSQVDIAGRVLDACGIDPVATAAFPIYPLATQQCLAHVTRVIANDELLYIQRADLKQGRERLRLVRNALVNMMFN